MNSERIFAKAEAYKRRAHRLTLSLKIKSLPEARKFLREQGVVLWSAKSELPNFLDAILGRIANGRERVYGNPAENCFRWRGLLMPDPELLECRFFRKRATVVHQDLWAHLTTFSRLNRKAAEQDGVASRDAKRIMAYLRGEGPTRSDHLRRALKYHSVEEGKIFHRAKQELMNQLIVLGREDQNAVKHTHAEILDFWENWMPKPIRSRADQLTEKEARNKLLAATLHTSVLTPESNVRRWFYWCKDGMEESLESLMKTKDFLRLEHRKERWIISRKGQ